MDGNIDNSKLTHVQERRLISRTANGSRDQQLVFRNIYINKSRILYTGHTFASAKNRFPLSSEYQTSKN